MIFLKSLFYFIIAGIFEIGGGIALIGVMIIYKEHSHGERSVLSIKSCSINPAHPMISFLSSSRYQCGRGLSQHF